MVTRNAFGNDRATTTGREIGGAAVFRIERLRYRYPQAQDRAVDDVSFTVAEFYCRFKKRHTEAHSQPHSLGLAAFVVFRHNAIDDQRIGISWTASTDI